MLKGHLTSRMLDDNPLLLVVSQYWKSCLASDRRKREEEVQCRVLLRILGIQHGTETFKTYVRKRSSLEEKMKESNESIIDHRASHCRRRKNTTQRPHPTSSLISSRRRSPVQWTNNTAWKCHYSKRIIGHRVLNYSNNVSG